MLKFVSCQGDLISLRRIDEMASQLHRYMHLFLLLTSLIVDIYETDGLSLTITESGQRLDITGPTLTVIGQKQCVRECLQRGDCQSVNYWRESLRCQLNPSTVIAGVGLLPDPGCIYMEEISQPQVRSLPSSSLLFFVHREIIRSLISTLYIPPLGSGLE
jgi:hypothetical protein